MSLRVLQGTGRANRDKSDESGCNVRAGIGTRAGAAMRPGAGCHDAKCRHVPEWITGDVKDQFCSEVLRNILQGLTRGEPS